MYFPRERKYKPDGSKLHESDEEYTIWNMEQDKEINELKKKTHTLENDMNFFKGREFLRGVKKIKVGVLDTIGFVPENEEWNMITKAIRNNLPRKFDVEIIRGEKGEFRELEFDVVIRFAFVKREVDPQRYVAESLYKHRVPYVICLVLKNETVEEGQYDADFLINTTSHGAIVYGKDQPLRAIYKAFGHHLRFWNSAIFESEVLMEDTEEKQEFANLKERVGFLERKVSDIQKHPIGNHYGKKKKKHHIGGELEVADFSNEPEPEPYSQDAKIEIKMPAKNFIKFNDWEM